MTGAWHARLVRFSNAQNFAEIERDQLTPDEALQALLHLHSLRHTLGRCRPVVEAALAAQGDRADRDLIDLQHCLAALLQPPADQKPGQLTQT
jgi:hypothetical protein